jgi:N-acetylneuraminate synthase
MMNTITIGNRKIGESYSCYIVAEMSANHGQSFAQAVEIIHAAREAGADAVKIQTYTPDTITMKSDGEPFRVKGTLWHGRTLYDLYAEAYTPWDWQPRLKEEAEKLGMALFSSPFDVTAVDFLETMHMPAYKVASFEIVDIPLLERLAAAGKPVIVSTGMATLSEIDEAVRTLKQGGAKGVALLKCTSAYPAPPEEINLRSIPHLAQCFNVPVGISDHTLGIAVPVAAVALGATIVEKHFTLSRNRPGPDSSFSLEPMEFRQMVDAIRVTEKACGEIGYEPSASEIPSRAFRRSLFVVEGVKAGDRFTQQNVRSIRPAHGLHPRYLREVLGRRAAVDIDKGTPLSWSLIA